MRVLQVTNIVSHHQLPLARQLAMIVGGENFRFVATKALDSKRQKMGWNTHEQEPWVLRAGEHEGDRKECEYWWDKADVVICGERRFKRMQDRMNNGKLTFYMSERWWKPPIGIARLLHPSFSLMTCRFLKLAASPFFHYLPMGYFAAVDMRKIAPFTGRMWQWGYFTELPSPLPSWARDSTNLRVLWAGRSMRRWKRVDTLIRAFKSLQQEHRDATLTLVGDGPERKRLEQLAKKLLAEKSYQFLSPIPASEVLALMQQHHIYVLPSNGYEGWGAVVNEAMSAGCAVVASAAAGSAKTLIEHGTNGLLFTPGDWQTLAEHLIFLGRNEAKRLQLAQAGQRTITELWSPALGAGRFVKACEALLSYRPVPEFKSGPMAPMGG
jgi:glycosyltransferase involved in cell wall biosynthesis